MGLSLSPLSPLSLLLSLISLSLSCQREREGEGERERERVGSENRVNRDSMENAYRVSRE